MTLLKKEARADLVAVVEGGCCFCPTRSAPVSVSALAVPTMG